MTPYTPEEIALAEEIADRTGRGPTSNIWQGAKAGALLAIRATTERAAEVQERHALGANHHLKDRPSHPQHGSEPAQ